VLRQPIRAPPDPIVANLVADYARLVALDAIGEQALPIYKLALAYHPTRSWAPSAQDSRWWARWSDCWSFAGGGGWPAAECCQLRRSA
jgi:hypothetical protein